MSRQYDFTILGPREFEFLCRDLIQRKISEETKASFLFNSFSEGSDGGIDAIYKNKDQYIVLQCKRYKYFDSLYSHLRRSELPKVKKLNPQRYILAVSNDLSKDQVDKLFDLFTPYIREIGDICGSTMLNNLLTCYPDIELNYPRLFLHNMLMLDRMLNADVLNDSESKINEFRSLAKFYVQNDAFRKAIDIIKKSHYVIISGGAGVGKTTMAGMLSLYYSDKNYEFIFIRRDIREARKMFKNGKKQLFLFDDFLGATTFHQLSKNEDRDLLDFIKDINKSRDKLLLITTREYVFRQAEVRYPELRELEYAKCVIEQKEFTESFKINILYNYLYYSRVEWRHVQPLLYNQNYNRIIHNRNFTPRIISYYIEKYYDNEGEDYDFYIGLKEYVEDPYEYWERVFLRLSESAQMLLLILAITEEPAVEEIIFKTYKKLGQYRRLFENGYETDVFKEALGELTGSFISLRYNPQINRQSPSITSRDLSLMEMSYRDSAFIGFQNPSIKDFSVKYLSKRLDLVEYLLKSAASFNQFFLVFATRPDDDYIGDDEAEFPHHGDKILLPEHLQKIVINRVTSEFDNLWIWKVRHIVWQGGDESYHIDEELLDNRVEKLRLLTFYFPLQYYPEIREFILKTYDKILEEDRTYNKNEDSDKENGINPLVLEERMLQPELVGKLIEFIQFDPEKTIKEYYFNIESSREFISLHQLGQLFPEAYFSIITKNIKRIRKEIKHRIYDDIDGYLWDGSHEAEESLDRLLDIDIVELMKIYNFGLSKTFQKGINLMAGRDLFPISEEKQETEEEDIDTDEDEEATNDTTEEERKALNEQRYAGYKAAVERLARLEWSERWSRLSRCRYIYSKFTPEISRKLIKRISDCEYYEDWANSPEELDMLLNYLMFFDQDPATKSIFYDGLLKVSNICEDDKVALQAAAYYLWTTGHFIFRKETVERFVDVEKYYQFVAKRDTWFTFLDRDFHNYLAARYIASLPDKEKIEIYGGIDKLSGGIDKVWRFLNELDGHLIRKHFLMPIIEGEIGGLRNLTDDEKVFQLLEKYSPEFEFQYDNEGKVFGLSVLDGGDSILEDAMSLFFELDTYDLVFSIQGCFNLSYQNDFLTRAYLEVHCPVEEGWYSVDVGKALLDKEFKEIIKTSGVKEKVIEYIEGLSRILEELKNY